MSNCVDEKTLFAGLHGELNSRVGARAAISTAHLQTIVAFAAGFLITKASGPTEGGPSQTAALALMICGLMPAISYYFISLYAHNDLQIGLLNQCLRELEERNLELPEVVRFYRMNGPYSASYDARGFSHAAVIMLAMLSPILITIDTLIRIGPSSFDALMTMTDNPAVIVVVVLFLLLNVHNLWRLIWLSKERRRLRDTRPKATTRGAGKPRRVMEKTI